LKRPFKTGRIEGKGPVAHFPQIQNDTSGFQPVEKCISFPFIGTNLHLKQIVPSLTTRFYNILEELSRKWVLIIISGINIVVVIPPKNQPIDQHFITYVSG